MDKNRYWEITRSDWYGTVQVLFAFIAIIMISSVFLLAIWHTKNFAYLCPGCGEVFEVSTLEDFISPNGVNKKYLRCPRCGKRAWADILRIKEKTVHKK